ncbi:hypothetical protein FAZ19_23645 [Sphingobacterium alkalisoli]|uniref:Lipoprotein n=1 Tax=Sphingobacterium alkalisoli TaxID=1874115 RepID=A0A4U0GLT9_9SPHI|nr:hypothetical protein [Sphingobacterium alkalisoli]TJY59683.1 hypothetical protein FAZ19_23645 [Sphingobacterium alkalisoli]GGH33122.1 hypothetical protein GCM10011418_47120 [Sphingobacterium alkalisoli]
MKKIHKLKVIAISMISSILTLYTSCDFIAAGSNLMAERYEFEISRDSIMQTLMNFNAKQIASFKDSIFRVGKGDPYFYEGYAINFSHNEIYYLSIPIASSRSHELLLISVRNIQSGEIFIINKEPNSKHEITLRKTIIKNFEQRVLDKLGVWYVNKGNAMNKGY